MAITKIKSGSSFTSLVKYDSFLAGNSPYIPSTFDLIQTTTLSTSAASVSFSVGGSSYTDFYLLVNARTDTGSTKDQLLIQMNGDTTTSNYSSGYNAGDGTNSLVSSLITRTTSTAGIKFAGLPGANASSGSRGFLEIDLFNINSNYYKTVIGRGGFTDISGTPNVTNGAYNGSWRSTSAVTSLLLKPASGGNFVSTSTFSLYGIRHYGGGGF